MLNFGAVWSQLAVHGGGLFQRADERQEDAIYISELLKNNIGAISREISSKIGPTLSKHNFSILIHLEPRC